MRSRMRVLHRLTCLAAAVGLCAAALGGATGAEATVPGAGTPPTISQDTVMAHLRALQGIADRDGGNRAHGTKGYWDSLVYVKTVLDRAGFRTTVQPFTYAGA